MAYLDAITSTDVGEPRPDPTDIRSYPNVISSFSQQPNPALQNVIQGGLQSINTPQHPDDQAPVRDTGGIIPEKPTQSTGSPATLAAAKWAPYKWWEWAIVAVDKSGQAGGIFRQRHMEAMMAPVNQDFQLKFNDATRRGDFVTAGELLSQFSQYSQYSDQSFKMHQQATQEYNKVLNTTASNKAFSTAMRGVLPPGAPARAIIDSYQDKLSLVDPKDFRDTVLAGLYKSEAYDGARHVIDVFSGKEVSSTPYQEFLTTGKASPSKIQAMEDLNTNEAQYNSIVNASMKPNATADEKLFGTLLQEKVNTRSALIESSKQIPPSERSKVGITNEAGLLKATGRQPQGQMTQQGPYPYTAQQDITLPTPTTGAPNANAPLVNENMPYYEREARIAAEKERQSVIAREQGTQSVKTVGQEHQIAPTMNPDGTLELNTHLTLGEVKAKEIRTFLNSNEEGKFINGYSAVRGAIDNFRNVLAETPHDATAIGIFLKALANGVKMGSILGTGLNVSLPTMAARLPEDQQRFQAAADILERTLETHAGKGQLGSTLLRGMLGGALAYTGSAEIVLKEVEDSLQHQVAGLIGKKYSNVPLTKEQKQEKQIEENIKRYTINPEADKTPKSPKSRSRQEGWK